MKMLYRVQNSIVKRRDKSIRTALNWGLAPVPLRTWQALDRRRLCGLFYHSVNPNPQSFLAPSRYKTPQQFRADIQYLKSGFYTPDYNELRSHVIEDKAFAKPSTFVSFDDGLRDCIEFAAPILQEFDFPALFFINSDFIDNRKMFYRHKASLCISKIDATPLQNSKNMVDEVNRRLEMRLEGPQQLRSWLYELNHLGAVNIDPVCEIMDVDWRGYLQSHKPYMTSSEVLELERRGFVVGAHTKDHKLLSLLPSEDAVKNEVLESCEAVKNLTARAQVPFAFPFHGRGLSRTLLEQIWKQNDVVDLMFDATGIGAQCSWLVNRFWADPSSPDADISNIPELLTNEYVKQIY